MRRAGRATRQAHTGELSAFNSQLVGEGRVLREVGADGNCLFRSVADQLYGDESSHLHVRTHVASFMADNEARFLPFLAPGTRHAYQKYCSLIARPGQWGGHLELAACAAAYNVDITIHQLNKKPQTVFQSDDSTAEIHLAYHCWTTEHYNSCVPLRGGAAEPPLPPLLATLAPEGVSPNTVLAEVSPNTAQVLAAAAATAAAAEQKAAMTSTSPPPLAQELAASLERMSMAQLQAKHLEVFGKRTYSTREWWIRQKLASAMRVEAVLAS